MRAALRAVRAREPELLILAVPVAARDTLDSLRAEADEIVCLETPRNLGAIGYFYDDFHQLSDDEVIAMLDRAGADAQSPRPA